MGGQVVPKIRLLSMSALGSFSWRWPEEVEAFDRGWAVIAEIDDLQFRLRHGVGRRVVYGRSRIHSVTWLEGQPIVEGVEADDFAKSESLLSLIKVSKRHLKPGDEVPAGYSALPVAVMANEAAGRYSPQSLAVKLRLDDIEGWTRHALLRAAAWDRLRQRSQRASLPPAGGPGPAAATDAGQSAGEDSRAAIAAAVLKFGRKRNATVAGPAAEFTSDPAANDLIRSDPFAFLLAVIMDQGIPAERAWLAPYLLKQRLGHLAPERIAKSEVAVRAAVQRKPKLHRYVENMPRWLVLAARRVVDEYGGDAGAIWEGNPAADDLQHRLDSFVGIGQKKAAMAVEILERDLRVPIRNMKRGEIAYDVHLRRVFLRTRLVDYDDRDAMITVARELNPARPGELDLPTWLIGRGWCHPAVPDCLGCPLTLVCPKDIERAAAVTSG